MGFPSFDTGNSEYQEFYFPTVSAAPRKKASLRRGVWLLPLMLVALGIPAFWLSGTAMTLPEAEVAQVAPVSTDAAKPEQSSLTWGALNSAPAPLVLATEAETLVSIPLRELEELHAARAELEIVKATPAVVMVPDLVGAEKLTDIEEVRSDQLVALQTVPQVVEVIEEVQSAAFACVEKLRDIAAMSTVYFDSGSAELDANGRSLLHRVGAAAAECPEAQVQISGHSDSSGSDFANLNLSWLRAETALQELERQEFDVARFEAVGFGARLPSAQGSDADLDQDRRVEFKVILAPLEN